MPGSSPGMTKGRGEASRLLALLLVVVLLVLLGALEGGAENVSQSGAGIGGAVLGDRLLLLSHFQRLDRHRDLVSLAVELGDAGIDLFADRKAFGALIGAVARELRALDKGVETAADDFNLQPGFLHFGNFAGDHRAFLD